MGVLACDRSGCETVMCDRYSPKFGYICSMCFQELCRSNLDIGVFMETEAGSWPQSKGRQEEYREEFQIRQ